jgi:hypothetical protein
MDNERRMHKTGWVKAIGLRESFPKAYSLLL